MNQQSHCRLLKPAQKLPTPPNDQVLCLSPVDVRKTLSRVDPRKAAGPDNIPGRVLRDCAEQLTDVLTYIFNISLSQAVVPTCLKSTTITPVPKKSPVSCLNDYHSTDPNYDEVLWEVSHAPYQIQSPQHTWPAPVCIPSKPLNGRCHFLHPPPGSYPLRKQRLLC